MKDHNAIELVFPARDEGYLCDSLCILTAMLAAQGHSISGGCLGGRWGYGARFENDTFLMHPYCWCENDDCRWCGEEEAPNFLHKPTGFSVHWYKYIGRGMNIEMGSAESVFLVIDDCFNSIVPRR